MSLEAVAEGLAVLGLKLSNTIAGAVGSFISLNFFDGLSRAQKWSTFVGGWALGAWLAEPMTAVLELPAKVEIGLAILVALFGMSIAAQFIKLEWGDVFWAVLGKFGIKKADQEPNQGG